MERPQAAVEKSEREKALFVFPEVAMSSSPRASGDEMWTRLPQVNLDKKRVAQKRIVTLDRSDNANFTFDILRTKILKTLRQNNWTSVAITSPTQGCGKTLVGLNLAFSFANLKDCRTVLVDLDLRRPQVGGTLGVEKIYSMERFLKGASSIEETFVRYGDNLAIGANGQPVSYAAELLQSPDTARILSSLKDRLKPDILLFDLPPMQVNDDVLALLPNVDCAILVVAAEASTLGEVDICERSLSAESNFLGVVLNKCHFGPDEHGY
ncbi:CpsD/CapB family tyrosine-protein kinase [Microvirga alba]|uniref:CpsD/CapB family tyrosine-protein kinase n=1 Tax=Microvirga alba TaxID=2791025 RepID=A0A931BU97_9HYPH|nr:CpsD/CapB family tyrosine-protein kinase [Microvirga alba]MBF9233920.1 CpsD/CapB family tyrosine-protein kinase [Microvirga alba]